MFDPAHTDPEPERLTVARRRREELEDALERLASDLQEARRREDSIRQTIAQEQAMNGHAKPMRRTRPPGQRQEEAEQAFEAATREGALGDVLAALQKDADRFLARRKRESQRFK